MLRNLPNRWLARVLRLFIFCRGRLYSAPGDGHSCFKDRILRVLTTHEQEHYGFLAAHIGRHLQTLRAHLDSRTLPSRVAT